MRIIHVASVFYIISAAGASCGSSQTQDRGRYGTKNIIVTHPHVNAADVEQERS